MYNDLLSECPWCQTFRLNDEYVHSSDSHHIKCLVSNEEETWYLSLRGGRRQLGTSQLATCVARLCWGSNMVKNNEIYHVKESHEFISVIVEDFMWTCQDCFITHPGKMHNNFVSQDIMRSKTEEGPVLHLDSCFLLLLFQLSLSFVPENKNWLDIWNGFVIKVRNKCNGFSTELSVWRL